MYHGQYQRGLLEAEVVALDRYARDNDRLTMPVAMFHGTSDPFVPLRALAAGGEGHAHRRCRHPHLRGRRPEVLDDSDRDEASGHLADWLDEVAPA